MKNTISWIITPTLAFLFLLTGPIVVFGQEETGEVVELEEYNVYSSGQASALEARRYSNRIGSFLSASDIGALPDDTLGEALTRLAGVNVVGNGDVSIRGLQGSHNAINIDGLSLPNARQDSSDRGADQRSFDVSLIPSEIVESVEVIKSLTADIDADSIGGSINVKTRTAFSFDERYVSYKLEYRYFEEGGEGGLGANFSFADKLNKAGTLGMFLNITYKDDNEHQWKSESRQRNNPTSADEIIQLDRFSPRDKTKQDRNMTISATFDYKLSENTNLYFKPYVRWGTRTEYRHRARFREFDEREGNSRSFFTKFKNPNPNWEADGEAKDYRSNWFFLDAFDGQPLGEWKDTDGDGLLGTAGDVFLPLTSDGKFPDHNARPSNLVVTHFKESSDFRVVRRLQDYEKDWTTYRFTFGGVTVGEKSTLEYAVSFSEDDGINNYIRGDFDQFDSDQQDFQRARYDISDPRFPRFVAWGVSDDEGHIPMNADMAALGPEERDDLPVSDPIFQAHLGIPYSGPPANPEWDPFALDHAPLQQFRDRISLTNETRFVAKVDYTRQWSDNLSLKFGAKIRNLKRSRRMHFRDNRMNVDYDDLPTMQDFISGAFGENNSFGGRYKEFAGPRLDIRGDLQDFFLTTSAEDPDLWLAFSGGEYMKSTSYNYEIDETIIAAYAMGTAHIGEKLTVLAGLRYERTETEATWVASAVIPPTPDLPRLEDVTETRDYGSLFPSIVATYRAGQDGNHVFRAAFSTTISRPDYEEIVPHDRRTILEVWPESDNFDENEDTFFGNPDLKEQRSLNFDLGWEWYYGGANSLSVNAFYKDTKDFLSVSEFQQEVLIPIDPEDPPDEGEEPPFSLRRSSFSTNAATQEIKGVEVSWNQSFEFLPSPLDGFGLVFNFTYIKGEQSRPNYLEEDLLNNIFTLDPDQPFLEGNFLTNQPERIYNFQLYWEKWGFSARLAYNYVGVFLKDTNDVRFKTFQSVRETTDLAFSYRLSKRMSIFLDLRNIGETPQFRTYKAFPGYLENYSQDEMRWVFGFRGKL